MALLGSRAVSAWGTDGAPDAFSEAVRAEIERNRARGLALEALSAELVARLAGAEIRALVLKGPLMARRLHGDAGFRISNDVDLLVRREDLPSAVLVLAQLGYVKEVTPARSHGLPDIHYLLRNPKSGLPRIDLHWRVHWYEEGFSRALLARSRTSGSVFLEPDPQDELATLMLFYARDGFFGLRTAADIAAWCDRHLGDQRPLDRHWREYPRLRNPLAAAALAAERAVGVSGSALAPESALGRMRPRLAAALARWNQLGEVDQLAANVALVDALLSPVTELRHFARRRLFVSGPEIELIYGLPESARARVAAMRIIHGPKVALRFLAGLWSIVRPPPESRLGEGAP